jgi:hypothetical protein
VVALLLCAAGYAIQFAMFPGTDDQDAAIHALFARFPNSYRLLSVFARPLFAIIYVVPARLGYSAMRLLTLLICMAMAWLAYRTACRLGLSFSWLVIPLSMTQPALYRLGTETMTEPIFALVFAAGLLALATDRRLTAALILSFLPLARPEGPIILAAVAACWAPQALKDRKALLAIVLLGTGMLLWWLVTFIVTREPRYLAQTFPWALDTAFVHGSPFDYLVRWPLIVGVAVCAFSLVGMAVSWRSPTLRVATVATLAVFGVHSYLWAAGRFASWGFDRYFATLAPATGLLATAGVGTLLAKFKKRTFAATMGPLLAAQIIQAFVVNLNADRYVSVATKRAVGEVTGRFDLRQRTFLSADHFGYVFADASQSNLALPVGDSTRAAAYLQRQAAGTVVLWDDVTGKDWYHLTADAISAHGYRIVWDQQHEVVGPPTTLRTIFRWVGWALPVREVRESVLVKI